MPGIEQTVGANLARPLGLTETCVDGGLHFPFQITLQSSTTDSLKGSETCALGVVLTLLVRPQFQKGNHLNRLLQLASKGFLLDCTRLKRQDSAPRLILDNSHSRQIQDEFSALENNNLSQILDLSSIGGPYNSSSSPMFMSDHLLGALERHECFLAITLSYQWTLPMKSSLNSSQCDDVTLP